MAKFSAVLGLLAMATLCLGDGFTIDLTPEGIKRFTGVDAALPDAVAGTSIPAFRFAMPITRSRFLLHALLHLPFSGPCSATHVLFSAEVLWHTHTIIVAIVRSSAQNRSRLIVHTICKDLRPCMPIALLHPPLQSCRNFSAKSVLCRNALIRATKQWAKEQQTQRGAKNVKAPSEFPYFAFIPPFRANLIPDADAVSWSG
jgi:hypothetical protein